MAPTTPHNMSDRYHWSQAKSLMPLTAKCEKGPMGALVPDVQGDEDHIAVVYDKGDTPPEITIKQVSGTVHTVLANGIAVAVIARATGKVPTASDVLLVERSVQP
ncbi:hypothetical protein [Sulfitobacter donghicola]|uniref:Uncharacterized protein n=1 Tax=Sulfitobacter donghicola DSW-25 = KCTC 12864 = JCM 14565 TaxID=1300350 RepID=A0A073IVV3_9RHOB|nr:hypothetical protein [Sulfitobacter donghicola]KEJ89492.1 hypothetical protein DSW25_10835 [Sulfitobacter donghicola DSW-25 = KCTC 12864 = JCM 14565]KIN69315.1 hypothetical protein Z948_3054 [Sulfitobacter donghicola DSW-25 = KCTC 12864 = JCM 14565]